ncbi:MAG: DUF3592 domain-containing protein [Bacteroidales bacterium]|nr:DUF3592 domain-containing protein [Bacteroidales bacterium]
MKNRFKSKYSASRNRFTSSEATIVKENTIPVFIKIAVMFSDIMATIGLVFTLFGGIFLFVMLVSVQFNTISVSDNSPSVNGEITDIIPTNTYINNNQVFEYHYKFKNKEGIQYSGISFASHRYDRPGDNVAVRYNEINPEESVIAGMETEQFPKWVLLFLLIFPVAGITMLYFGIKKGIRNVNILKFGKVAFGTYSRKEATNVSINKQAVYKFYFDFIATDGNLYTATGNTHKTYLLEDEGKEPVIYNSGNPEEAVLVDTLPKSVRRFFKKEIDKKVK